MGRKNSSLLRFNSREMTGGPDYFFLPAAFFFGAGFLAAGFFALDLVAMMFLLLVDRVDWPAG